MKRALVTGHRGFVGRHLSKRLLADGWEVAGCDIKEARTSGDCRTLFASTDVRYDLVIHCAAIVGGRAMIEGQPMAVATDLAIDSDFFQFVSRTQPHRAVYFSSSAAYPIALQSRGNYKSLQERWIDLKDVGTPDAIYGWVKLTGEQLAHYANRAGASVHVFRPFSGYGADQDLTYPFPSFVQKVRDRLSPFPVWGPGTQVRDWIHIDDIVRLVMNALDCDPLTLGPVNLCTGVPTAFLELADLFLREADYAAEVECDPKQPYGVHWRVGDPTKMRSHIGTPEITLEEGIARALATARA